MLLGWLLNFVQPSKTYYTADICMSLKDITQTSLLYLLLNKHQSSFFVASELFVKSEGAMSGE